MTVGYMYLVKVPVYAHVRMAVMGQKQMTSFLSSVSLLIAMFYSWLEENISALRSWLSFSI